VDIKIQYAQLMKHNNIYKK